MGVVDILRVYAQAASFVSGCLTVLCFFVHFFNPSKGGMQQCVAAEAPAEDANTIEGAMANAFNTVANAAGVTYGGGVSCIGPYLRFGSLDDINAPGWRKTFTLKPDDFVDLWTPLVVGAIQVVQHINNDMKIKMFSGNWLKVIIWNVIWALWGQFGYAGSIGVITGFITTCAFLPFALVLMFIDTEKDENGENETCLNLGSRLGIKACQEFKAPKTLTQRNSGQGGSQEPQYDQSGFPDAQRGSAAQDFNMPN